MKPHGNQEHTSYFADLDQHKEITYPGLADGRSAYRLLLLGNNIRLSNPDLNQLRNEAFA